MIELSGVLTIRTTHGRRWVVEFHVQWEGPVLSTLEAFTPEAESDAVLFGNLWPLANEIQLDPILDRKRFRRQCTRLKALHYTFQPLGQVWTQC